MRVAIIPLFTIQTYLAVMWLPESFLEILKLHNALKRILESSGEGVAGRRVDFIMGVIDLIER